ncbi:MAG: NB-ARC domain-containing protein [Saprospiraceae bacterium]
MTAIHQKLFAGDNIPLVNGQGGVGKTSIAARYYDRHKDHYAHTAWVLSERSIANALLSNLAAPLGLVFEQTAAEAERLNHLLRAMASLDKPCLLVIDNANELEDLEKNYILLRRCSNFHLLLTSRITHFEQAATHAIEGLPEAEALALFKRHYPKMKAEEEPLFAAIYHAVGGNTLVVELLAKNVALFHGIRQQYSLQTLLDDLQQKGVLALTKSAEVKTGYQAKDALRSETPEAIIAAMYDLSDLSREETALLSVFAVLPAESIGFEWLEMLLPNTVDIEKNALALAQRGWIEYDETNASFKCSPVIQEITRKKNEQLRADCETLIQHLIEKLKRDTLHEENYKYSAIFARYAETVISIFQVPNYEIALLCERTGDFHVATGNLEKANDNFEKCRDISKKLCEIGPDEPYNKNELAISYSKLGETHAALGNLDLALTFYQDDAELTKQLYDSYPNNVAFKNGLAISYERLGLTHAALGNLDLALTFYQDYNELEKQLYDSYPNHVAFKHNLAISYDKLGDTHVALGNLDLALTFYEERSALGKQLYDSYPNHVEFKNGLAISYYKLGALNADNLKDKAQAKTYFQQAEALWLELVRDAPQVVEFQRFLGIVQEDLQDL